MNLTTQNVSTPTLVVMAILSILALAGVRNSYGFNPWYKYKMEAAQLMLKAEQAIKQEKINRNIPINSTDDPNSSGLIGQEYSEITTDRGLLDAKMMTTNPNFAAVAVDLFKEAKLKKGDTVAVSFTGSMPAANIAILAAIEVMKLRPIIINSVGASGWGATDPQFTWLDMEKTLKDKGIFSNSSVAASLGGKEDQAWGIRDELKQLMIDAIKRQGIAFISEGTLEKNTKARMEIYRLYAKGYPIKLYVNVGGSVASLGRSVNGSLIPPGLSRHLDTRLLGTEGVVMQMAQRGIPVIHILKVRELVDEYRLPDLPVPMPNPGEAKTFYEERYSVKIAVLFITVLLGFMIILIQLDLFVIPAMARRMIKGQAK